MFKTKSMKKNAFLLLSLGLLATQVKAQGVRADGAVRLVASGAIQLVADGGVSINTGATFTTSPTSTFRLSGANQNADFGAGTTLGILLAEGTGNKTLQRNVTCATLTVNSGPTFIVPANIAATITSQLNYAGNVTVQSGGALIQTTGSTLGTSTGTFSVLRTGTGGTALVPRYNYWSSPVVNFPVTSIPAFVINALPFRFSFNNGTGVWDVANAGNMASTQGYAVVNGGNMTFTGTGAANAVHNGNYTPAVGPGFNLVGNPYPSPLNIATFMGANPTLDGSVWFWNDGGNYVTGTGTGNYVVSTGINPDQLQVANTQGFFVRRTGAGTNITFSNAQREVGNPTFYRGEEEMARFKLAVTAANGLRDYVLAGFRDDFTPAFDRGLDGEKMDGNNRLGMAAVQADTRYMNVALPTAERLMLPLTLHLAEAGAYTFAAEAIESPISQKLFLEDRQTGEFYYLQPGRHHTLNLPAGNHLNRFFLRASGEVVGQNAQSGETASAYSFGRDLFVEASENAEVSIFSPMGALVQRYHNVPAGGLRRLLVDAPIEGVYVVRLTTATGSVEKRIWLER
jgi:hypothetical protein